LLALRDPSRHFFNPIHPYHSNLLGSASPPAGEMLGLLRTLMPVSLACVATAMRETDISAANVGLHTQVTNPNGLNQIEEIAAIKQGNRNGVGGCNKQPFTWCLVATDTCCPGSFGDFEGQVHTCRPLTGAPENSAAGMCQGLFAMKEEDTCRVGTKCGTICCVEDGCSETGNCKPVGGTPSAGVKDDGNLLQQEQQDAGNFPKQPQLDQFGGGNGESSNVEIKKSV